MDPATARSTTRARPAGRPFRLVDVLILTAATGVGLAGARWVYEEILFQEFSLVPAGILLAPAMFAWPVMTAWMAALIPIRLIAPRPPRRRLAAQPGMAAACSTSLVMAFAAVVALVVPLMMSSAWMGLRADLIEARILGIPAAVSLAILSSWTTLALGGRWRPEPSWIDRLGRLLAVALIATGPGVVLVVRDLPYFY
ncbi:hypothetical protein [Paludisphaera mucosa]|uniref:Uncharacterized protein n=1 Tax=Paludisphaera mucosa TaxID=3030827 RepID=A0ABT6FJX4_9BACT|nr:hypothetical protein [Paludisphaera mucosa]MDG3007850.1 hypothetical protein [Paludisphaera mucosa]